MYLDDFYGKNHQKQIILNFYQGQVIFSTHSAVAHPGIKIHGGATPSTKNENLTLKIHGATNTYPKQCEHLN